MLRNYHQTNTIDGYSVVDTIHTENSGTHIAVTQVIDDTEGIGAIDTLPWRENTRNLDLGGGQFDTLTAHLHHYYRVTNLVYDPYARSADHNQNVLHSVQTNPVDTVTSHSVLNVILDPLAREHHIRMAYQALRNDGTAFFKVWRGNGSASASITQSNKEAIHYLGEILDVFGEFHAVIAQDDCGNTIIAKK